MPGRTTGGLAGDRGFYFQPTVIAGARQEDEMVRREVFGPVISVTPLSGRRPGGGMGH